MKLSLKEVRDFVNGNGSGDIFISTFHEGKIRYLKVLCRNCNQEYTIMWSNFRKGNRCRFCSMKKLWDNSRQPKEFVLQKINNCGYIILKDFDYKNIFTKIDIEDRDGYRYCVSFSGMQRSFENKKVLDRFNPGNLYTIYNISLWMNKNNRTSKIISGIYVGEKENTIRVECENGHLFNSSWMKIRNTNGKTCPFCAGLLVDSNNNLLILRPDLAEEWDYEKNFPLRPEEVIPGTHKKFYWVCKNCGNSWEALCSNRNNGKGCRKCLMSGGEKKIDYWLRENGFKNSYKYQQTFNDLKGIKGFLRYDFGVFSNKTMSEIIMLIEYDDEQHYKINSYFHKTEQDFIDSQERDETKNKYAKDNNIPLLRIKKEDFDKIEEILVYELNL